MDELELKNNVERVHKERERKKSLALRLVRTAAEQGISVGEFLSVLDMAKKMAMDGKLTPLD